MIKKQRKYKHKNKKLDKEEENKISKLTRTQHIVEEVKAFGKKLKIKRPLFFLEAKERFFTEDRGDN